MTKYFIDGEESPADIAEAVVSINCEILNDAIKSGDMGQLVNIKFVVCVETQ